MLLKSIEIIEAVKAGNLEIIYKFIAAGGDINASLVSSGPQSGYTALHFAVLEDNENSLLISKKQELLEKLIETYDADVNSVGDDGATPLQICSLRGDFVYTETLLELKADVNVKLTREVVKKYPFKMSKNWNWPEEFQELTLISLFGIDPSNENLEFLKSAFKYGANIELKDKNNKTLLMYIVEIGWEELLQLIIYTYRKLSPKFVNARDNSGLNAVHYLLPNKKFGEFRYIKHVKNIYSCINNLRYAGVNLNAMIDENPDTLLLNMSAYRCCYPVLEYLLEFDIDCNYNLHARPLKYFMIPVDPDKVIQDLDERKNIEERRNRCLKIIIESHTLRREFGFFVPQEEIKLMDKMVAENYKVKKMVEDFKENFIDNLKIEFRDGMTIYDLASKVFEKRSLNLLVIDQGLVDDLTNYLFENTRQHDKLWFCYRILDEIKGACSRRPLMKELEKISQLREFIPLPYEIVLKIIEYLDDRGLRTFIASFYDKH